MAACGNASTSTCSGLRLYARYVEPRWVEYVRVPMPLANLPSTLVGATVIQLSDLHIGNRFDWGYVITTLQRVQQLQPDFVVYTGDYVSYESPAQFDQLSTVLAHAPQGRLGTAAVLGNHDYGYGWNQPEVAQEIVQRLTAFGIPVLRNEIGRFSGLQIGGIDDRWGPNFDAERVTSQLQTDAPSLLLCHNPDAMDLPVWSNYRGWVLSGHTHGGQVKPPFLPPPVLPVRNERYTAGIFAMDDGRTLYINRALGCLWPVRFNVRPEVTIFTLETAG